MTMELRRLMREEVPPSLSTLKLLENLRQRDARHIRRRGRLAVTVIVMVMGLGTATAIALRPDAVKFLPAIGGDGLATCGRVPDNKGPAHTTLRATLHVAPGVLHSGERVSVGMVFQSRSGAAASFDTSNPEIVIAREGRVVGKYVGGNAGTGLGVSVEGASTETLPAVITLRGCSTGIVDPYNPDSSRPLLPPGNYELIAVAQEAVSDDPSTIVSEPAKVTLEP